MNQHPVSALRSTGLLDGVGAGVGTKAKEIIKRVFAQPNSCREWQCALLGAAAVVGDIVGICARAKKPQQPNNTSNEIIVWPRMEYA